MKNCLKNIRRVCGSYFSGIVVPRKVYEGRQGSGVTLYLFVLGSTISFFGRVSILLASNGLFWVCFLLQFCERD